MSLSAKAQRFFETRGIDPETAIRFGIYSNPQSNIGEVIVFPFFEDGEVVNNKYRGSGKKFWQDKDAKKTFWNVDALQDPLLEGDMRLVITEGELDALSAIECGFPLSVSVPDGAPPQASNEPIDPEHDDKFKFVWNNWDRLSRIKRIILAVDNDGPGRALASELVRRLGAVRCLFVEYPEGAKDLNDVLMKAGPEEVVRLLNAAKPYPVKGLYRMSDFPDVPEAKTFSTGWPDLDEHFRPFLGEFAVVTGIPNHGKSTWAMALICNLVMNEGLNATIASFEMNPSRDLRKVLRKYFLNAHELKGTPKKMADADAWIDEKFSFLYQDPRDLDEDGDLGWLIEKASDAVIRHGTNILLIDPWNEVEHRRGRNETETEYVSRAIRELKRFAMSYEVLTIVVAHPVKMGGGKEGVAKPSLYDISGSANWYNKCDHGIVVWRENIQSARSEVDVKKSRFQDFAGVPGKAEFQFNKELGRFEVIPEELDMG